MAIAPLPMAVSGSWCKALVDAITTEQCSPEIATKHAPVLRVRSGCIVILESANESSLCSWMVPDPGDPRLGVGTVLADLEEEIEAVSEGNLAWRGVSRQAGDRGMNRFAGSRRVDLVATCAVATRDD